MEQSNSNDNSTNPNIKYIVVCGASASAIGKGITVSSIASLLKAADFTVSMIKIDPYLNIDAGTMNPYEHGEVFVLDDGTEADLDLGNYERFLDINLQGVHNITTGKVYKKVLDKERKGQFLGKTVQIVPHVTDCIIDWIQTVAEEPVSTNGKKPDICLIELGGTVGDIESSVFFEALRQLQSRVGPQNMAFCLVCFVPIFGTEGEPKTKPAQHGFKELRFTGISPDFIVARSVSPLGEDVMKKLRLFSGVSNEKVINLPDLDSVYKVPVVLNEAKITEHLCQRLGLATKTPDMTFWNSYYHKDLALKKVEQSISIAFVGKYVEFQDSYISVIKAFQQCAIEIGLKVNLQFIESEDLEKTADNAEKYEKAWEKVKTADGIFVPGGFGVRGIEGKMAAIKHARENKIPFFGICYGFQLAVVEFCRNVLGWNAISEEYLENYEKTEDLKQVIIFMPDVDKENMGGTMRLGAQQVLLKEGNTWARKMYAADEIYERHRHRYEVCPQYIKEMEEHGLQFIGTDKKKERMEMLELKDHPFFFATQFHPELKARLRKPSPPFVAFVLAAAKRIDNKSEVDGGVLSFIPSLSK